MEPQITFKAFLRKRWKEILAPFDKKALENVALMYAAVTIALLLFSILSATWITLTWTTLVVGVVLLLLPIYPLVVLLVLPARKNYLWRKSILHSWSNHKVINAFRKNITDMLKAIYAGKFPKKQALQVGWNVQLLVTRSAGYNANEMSRTWEVLEVWMRKECLKSDFPPNSATRYTSIQIRLDDICDPNHVVISWVNAKGETQKVTYSF